MKKTERRGKGEGAVYQEASGRWVGCIDLRAINDAFGAWVDWTETGESWVENLRPGQRRSDAALR